MLGSEFDRVGQEIEGDLLERAPVGAQADAGRNLGADFEVFVLGACGHDTQGVAQFAVKLDVLQVELETSGLDLRHVEHVVDDVEQVFAAAVNVAAVLDIFVGAERAEHSRFHDLGETDDGIQRRAQLVAHVGEEF